MTTTNLNYEQFVRWNNNREINPKTNRSIKIHGPVYNEIDRKWQKLKNARDYSLDECKQWLSDKSVNPKTGRRISEGGLVYENIRSVCEYYAPQENIEELAEDVHEQEIAQQKRACSLFRRCGRVTLKYITIFNCGRNPCMARGCSWTGYFGINLTILPESVKKTIESWYKFLSGRCCCFCLGHMIMFITVIFNSFAKTFMNADVNYSIKVQSAVNKLNASVNVNETLSTLVKDNFNSQLTKFIASGEVVDWVKNLYAVLAPYVTGNFQSNLENLQEAIDD